MYFNRNNSHKAFLLRKTEFFLLISNSVDLISSFQSSEIRRKHLSQFTSLNYSFFTYKVSSPISLAHSLYPKDWSAQMQQVAEHLWRGQEKPCSYWSRDPLPDHIRVFKIHYSHLWGPESLFWSQNQSLIKR